MCGEIIDAEAKSYNEETKTVPISFNEKEVTSKTQNFYILFIFLLIIIIVLLIDLSIYYYLVKYQAKQKHLLPLHTTNNELKQVIYW